MDAGTVSKKTRPPLLIVTLLAVLLSTCRQARPSTDPSLYPQATSSGTGQVTQTLYLPGPDSRPVQTRSSPGDTLFVAAGRKMYLLGDIDGGFRPRSNPYDLYTFGHPLPTDPLANKLQGLWAQPVKALNGFNFEVDMQGETWSLYGARSFSQRFTDAQFEFQRGDLLATRTDFIPEDQPLLFTTLALRNQGSRPVEVTLRFQAYFDLQDAWFTSLTSERNQGETLIQEGETLIAQANSAPDAWAVAAGAETAGAEVSILDKPGEQPVGQFQYRVTLPSGGDGTWTFGVAVDSRGGKTAALQALEAGFQQRAALYEEKLNQYARFLQDGPRLHSPDPQLDLAFSVARLNLKLLEAESPALGRYFYAGLQTFPFWFSNDTAYSLPGLLASGLASSAENALLVGSRINTGGRVPHQISPAGNITGQGNAEETPLWVIAVWDAFRWSGDRQFLNSVYPQVVTGLLGYTLGEIDPDRDGYPSGPGMVEKEGMGAEKLDTAAYTWAALNALEQMALVMGDLDTAGNAREQIDHISEVFDQTWWDADGKVYAMSLRETDNTRIPELHWAVVTPLEVGLASGENAAATLETVEAQYLNQWGMQHTVGSDERVWTLPTATLSRAAYRYHRPDIGLAMLTHLRDTLDQGSIGLYHELIPDGLCTLQLWSSATFVRGIVEDLLGLQVRSDLHRLTLAPQLPGTWESVSLENLSFGGHRVDIRFSANTVTINHFEGPVDLAVDYMPATGQAATQSVPAGQTITFPR